MYGQNQTHLSAGRFKLTQVKLALHFHFKDIFFPVAAYKFSVLKEDTR